MLYLDLEELPTLFRRCPFWSVEGFGLARFRRRDHLMGLAPPEKPLADAVRDLVHARCGFRPGGAIRLLTHLEYFGYRFNPVSFFYCFDEQERLVALVAEINNTPWGEQHCYVLAPPTPTRGGSTRFEFDKQFHVSPFMPMNVSYRWAFTAPGARLAVHMDNFDPARRRFFDATLAMQRREISPARLTRLLFARPFMTLHVLAAIYWQAFRLYLKRCPVCPHPKTAPTPAGSHP